MMTITNLSAENISLQKTRERESALSALEKAKKIKRKTRILPSGMSGEDYRELLKKEQENKKQTA